MRWYRTQSMRRILLGGAFAATLAVGVALGALLTTNEATAQPAVTFTGPDAALMFHFVKPGSTADYEGVMQKLKDALEQSENTETDRQAQASGWRVFRANADFTGQGAVPYVWAIDPVMAGTNYAASTIMNEVFPGDIEMLFNTYNDAFTDGPNKQLPVNLDLVIDFAN